MSLKERNDRDEHHQYFSSWCGEESLQLNPELSIITAAMSLIWCFVTTCARNKKQGERPEETLDSEGNERESMNLDGRGNHSFLLAKNADPVPVPSYFRAAFLLLRWQLCRIVFCIRKNESRAIIPISDVVLVIFRQIMNHSSQAYFSLMLGFCSPSTKHESGTANKMHKAHSARQQIISSLLRLLNAEHH
jgi:hypothetical protein